MSGRKGTKGLELWCRKMTEGYPGVKIDNMTTSWRDGLAFCAIIHHFRPDLIDFSKLNKDDVYHNNELAFRVAEQYLGIPALLEPEDMVEYQVPDRLSILTYLSQFYQAFACPQGSSASRVSTKRPSQTAPDGIVSPTSSSPPTKISPVCIGKARKEPCARCGLPVFIAGRLNVGKLHFHRTCFKCARCGTQLTLDNYYETENSEFCCEVCPDEEKSASEKLLLQRSMSDEEKSASLKTFSNEPDDYSTIFETALEDVNSKMSSGEFVQARSQFIRTQMTFNEKPLDLPATVPSISVKSEGTAGNSLAENANCDSGFPSVKNDIVSNRFEETQDVTKDESTADDVKLSNDQNNFKHSTQKDIELGYCSSTLDSTTEASTVDNNFSKVVRRLSYADDQAEDQPAQKKSENSFTGNESKPSNDAFEKNKQSEQQEEGSARCNVMDAASDKESSIKNEEFDNINHSLVNEEIVNSEASEPGVVVIENCSDAENSASEESKLKISSSNSGTPDDVIVIEDSTSEISEHEDESVETSESLSMQKHQSGDDTAAKLTSKERGDEEYPDELNPFGDDEGVMDNKHKTSSNPFDSDDDEEEKEAPGLKKKITPDTDRITVGTPQRMSVIRTTRISINPFENEEPSPKVNLNPFESDSEDEASGIHDAPRPLSDYGGDEKPSRSMKPIPSPRFKKKINPVEDRNLEKPHHMSTIGMSRSSINPFEDDDSLTEPPVPTRRKKVIHAAKINFEGDSEDDTPERDKLPVPVPRPTRSSSGTPQPKPRENCQGGTLSLSTKINFGSSSSISSGSAYGSTRVKRPAPRPQLNVMRNDESAASSLTSSPSHSVHHSPRTTPRYRKNKKAPPPPPNVAHSTPFKPDVTPENVNTINAFNRLASPIIRETKEESIDDNDIQKEKSVKDERNRNRQTQDTVNPVHCVIRSDKSTHGKWKRRKGQAPSRPVPQRRIVKCLPMTEVKRELEMIEAQMQGLERQGIRIEQIIRQKCEGAEEGDPDADLPDDVEDLIMQLFELVNEKNELFRKQTELMYLRRQQRLEEEHADIEYQIRCLMYQPEANKTDSDKAREEELLKRLVEVVEKRNEIIECLEMDRNREIREDSSIKDHISMYTTKKDEIKSETGKAVNDKGKDKEKKKTLKKLKKLKLISKSSGKVDVDKDIDESETGATTLERKKKKKFALF